MARRVGPLATPLASNPYARARDIQPQFVLCELCDRSFLNKDWNGHKNGKEHRQNENEQRSGKENAAPGGGSASNNNNSNFNGGSSGAAAAGDTREAGASSGQDASWGWTNSSGNNTFDNSGKVMRRGGGDRDRGRGRACHSCGEEGHMKRDCPKASGRGACYNCGMTGHNRADCTEPLKPRGGDRVCFNCGETGTVTTSPTVQHPPKPREGGSNQDQQCYNCFEYGEWYRLKPKDWSKHQCSNCKEFGHSPKRCPHPRAEESTGGGWSNSGETGGAVGGWDDADASASGGFGSKTNVESTGNWADDTAAADSWGGTSTAGGW
ncbi:hypothetical protein N0V90_009306 [Kalmusia sp. IMI 367209]|nr:hypothetical protein N0V90_009306 [Kalmusia sp. IMI 367209]